MSYSDVVSDGGQDPRYVSAEFTCPLHGDIGNQTFSSFIHGHEMDLCLKCILEKLVEMGVSKAVKKNSRFDADDIWSKDT